MVTTTPDGQNPSVPTTVQVQIPNSVLIAPQQLKSQTQSTSAPAPETQCQLDTPPGHCPSETQAMLCPEACKPPQPEPTSPTEKPKEKKKGWMNGISNVIRVCYNTVYEKLVGEKGYLTNLPETFAIGGKVTKKTKKTNSNSDSNSSSGKGRTTACCIFYGSGGGPPVKDDDDKEEETENQTKDHAPPINCFFMNSNSKTQTTSSFPGIPAPVPVPVPGVPGTSTKTKSRQTNCCFVGKNLFIIRKFFKLFCKVQLNVCACTLNLHGVEG